MPGLVIDNINVEVDSGTTVLDAAKKLGIEIPTMCFLKEYKALTSCMICVVKIEGIESLMPGLILLAVFPQLTAIGFATVTMQATGRFLLSLLISKSFTFP